MTHPLSHHCAYFTFKVGVEEKERASFLETLFETASSTPNIDQSGLLSWTVDGEWRDDKLEEVLIPFLPILDNTGWQYEYENEVGFIRIYNGELQGCGIMPNGHWNKITFSEEVTA